MINIYPSSSTSTFVVWPDSGTEIVGTETGSYSLSTTHTYDLSQSTFPVSRSNTPNNLSEMLVFQYSSGSGAPDKSGQYTFDLNEGEKISYTWGDADVEFTNANFRYSESFLSGSKVIDSGRLFIHGTNDPEFNNYITDNENGEYITYYT